MFVVCSLQLSPFVSSFEDSRTLASGEYHGYDITGYSDSSKYLVFDLDVLGSVDLDIYILNSTEYTNYGRGADFNAIKEYERTLDRNFSWMQRESGDHYLVIDNKDNAHSNDARPTGDISYTMGYHTEDYKDGSHSLLWMYVCLAGFLLAVFIVIILVMVKGTGFLVRKVRGRDRGLEPTVSPLPTQVDGGQWRGEPPSSVSGSPAYRHQPRPPSLGSHSGYRPPDSSGRPPPVPVPDDYRAQPPFEPSQRPSPKLPRPVGSSGVRTIDSEEGENRASSPRSEPCPGCNNPVKADWKVCPQCSRSLVAEHAPVPKVCNDCGQTLESEWKVCPKCASPVVEPGPALCPGCQSEVESDWKACPLCASPLGRDT